MKVAELEVTKDGATKTFRILRAEVRRIYEVSEQPVVSWQGKTVDLGRKDPNSEMLLVRENDSPQSVTIEGAKITLSQKPIELRDLRHVPASLLGTLARDIKELTEDFMIGS